MLSILSGYLNILADGILVGQCIGIDGLAAINLCVPLYLLLCVVGSFFVSGTAIPASEEIGKGNMEKAQHFYGTSLTTCLIASAVATLIGLLTLSAVSSAFSSVETIRAMIRSYAGVTMAGALPKILIYIPFWYLRLEGKNKSVTVMMVILGGGNVALDILFLYGFNMGVFGAALASVIATAAACVFGFIRIHMAPTNFSFRPAFVKSRKEWRRIISSGSPAALNNLLQTVRCFFINSFLGAYGGSVMIATFTAVNGIAAFSEMVTVGVPNAGTAMLGVYYGERDNGSVRILFRREWWDGFVSALIFGVVIVACSGLIRDAYALTGVSLFIPMLCLATSLIPGLWNNMLISLYNVSGHAILSDVLIACRVLIFAVVSLFLCQAAGLNIWLFLLLAEVFTTILWFVLSWIISKRRKHCTRFLLMDTMLQESGQVINFSLPNSPDQICDACEKISEFCAENNMVPKEYMKISLSMEELMTLISQINKDATVTFDLRVFSLQDVIGIRIRYDGVPFDPIHDENREGEEFMGLRMIEKMVENIIYRKVFGVNTLMILI